MMIPQLLILISLLWVETYCSFVDRLFEQENLLGTWKQSQVLPPLGPCLPCYFQISFSTNDAVFEIKSSQQSQITHHFQLYKSEESDDSVFLDRTLIFRGNKIIESKDVSIFIKIECKPREGSVYSYTVEIPQYSLIINQQETKHEYSVLLTSCICSIVLFFLFPLDKHHLQKSLPDLHSRTCLFSLFLYAQLVVTGTMLQFAFVVLYIFFSQSMFQKFICYGTLGSCFLIWLINSACILAVIQKRMNQYLPTDNLFKLFILIISLFVGVICYPLILMTFHKGIWYFYINISGLVVQLVISYLTKKVPFHTFSYMYCLLIVYLALQTNFYPIANFHELSFVELGCLFIFVVILLLIGGFLMKSTKNAQLIESMFQQSKPERSTDTNTISNNEEFMDKKAIEKQKIDIEAIRSDFQLEMQNQ